MSALKLLAGVPDKLVELGSTVTLGALLQLRVDIHRHLRVGVPDLAHDPLDVEVVGEQFDRDVGATERVRRGVRQRRQVLRREPLGRARSGVADDLLDAAVAHPGALEVRHQVVRRPCRRVHAAQPVEVVDDGLHEVGRHLDLAYPRFGLGVGNVQARSARIVQAHVADLQVAQLARAQPATTEDLDHGAPADIAAPDLQAEVLEVEGDGGLRQAKLSGDLDRRSALSVQLGHLGGGQAEVDRGHARPERDVLLIRGVDQRGQLVELQKRAPGLGHLDPHTPPTRGIGADVPVLDSVVEDRDQPVDHHPHRRWAERFDAPAVVVANVGAGVDRLPQLPGLLEEVRLERETEVAVDLLQPVGGEERQQVRLDPPAVLRGRGRPDRLFADDSVDAGLQPARGVFVERQRARSGRRAGLGPPLRRRPHSRFHAGEHVVELDRRGALVPASAAPAVAVAALM